MILPTLNEADNIRELLDRIRRALPSVREMIVVDDDSTDGTRERALEWASEDPGANVRIIHRTTAHGLTASIRQGVQAAVGDIVVWMDCDLSMPPELIPTLVEAVEIGYDIAVGSRFVAGGSFKRNTRGTPDSAIAVGLSRLMNYFIQFVLDHRFKDYTSGFIAARRDVVSSVGLRGDYGEYFIDLMFRAMRTGCSVLELPYVCVPRRHGVSKTGASLADFIRRGSKYVAVALGLRAWAVVRARPSRLPPRSLQAEIGTAVVRAMSIDDVPQVAGLHHRILHDTIGSRLGIPFLERLYRVLLGDVCAFAHVAVAAGRVVGFVSATTDLLATERRAISRTPVRERLLAAYDVLTDARRFRSWIAHRRLIGRLKRMFGRDIASILTLGVDPALWGSGIAESLIGAVDQGMGTVPSYLVDTREDNDRARAFYKRVGFRELATEDGNVIFVRQLGSMPEHVDRPRA